MQEKKALNPYFGGVLAGLLLTVSVALTGNYYGTSTTLIRIGGMIEKLVAPQHMEALTYLQRFAPIVDWQFMFVIGIFLGSLIVALVSRDYHWRGTPNMWKERFGDNVAKRGLVAFIGGIIAVIGARLAGGCPSGQLSAMAQLSFLGFIAIPSFFIGGLLVAKLMYARRD